MTPLHNTDGLDVHMANLQTGRHRFIQPTARPRILRIFAECVGTLALIAAVALAATHYGMTMP